MLHTAYRTLALSALVSTLIACQSDPAQTETPTASDESPSIQVNQLGFYPHAAKVAAVPAGAASDFELVDTATGQVVYQSQLGEAKVWPVSGETVQLADFSDVEAPGRYVVRVEGLADSAPLEIRDAVYGELNDAVIKAYYFNRASTELLAEHAGDYARPMGHPDDSVAIHSSAASEARPEGTELSSPKGWYDAGDYNKYIVNSGISTYTLLAAYEHFPAFYRDRDLNIPESGNSVPDLLDESMWNLVWMLTMQDPHDGGVYHKLTTLNFSGAVMPHEATEPRYMVQKGTAAALNFAATMAVASRVYADYEAEYPGFSEQALSAAKAAWDWAKANPDVIYRNPEDVRTGEYGDDEFSDEFVWAAVELALTTGDERYWDEVNLAEAAIEVPSWADAVGQPWMSMAHHLEQVPEALQAPVKDKVAGLAQDLRDEWRASASGVPMRAQDFVWGSNGVAMNMAMMMLTAHQLSDDSENLQVAQSLMDYVLGRNPTGYSYVTGFGARTPQHIHHRPSEADTVAAPVPGFLAGGPHSGQQDAGDCPVAYPSDKPAKSYLDHWCSYASNEITINWNAPLVYVSGALEVLSERR